MLKPPLSYGGEGRGANCRSERKRESEPKMKRWKNKKNKIKKDRNGRNVMEPKMVMTRGTT